MRLSERYRVLIVLVISLAVAYAWAWSRSAATMPLAPPVILRVDTSHRGNAFASGAVGLSTEARELSSGSLDARHSSLVRLMRLLGPSILRIGGDSVDLSWWTSGNEPAPSWATSIVAPADLYRLRRLLAATGWRALLGVDLGHFEPNRAADEARYARRILGVHLLGVEIGNEPNDFGRPRVNLRPSNYGPSEYMGEAATYARVLRTAVPDLAIYGPALSQTTSWLTEIGVGARTFTEFTQHYYPTSMCPGALHSRPLPTADGLLSPAVRLNEDEVLAALAHAGARGARVTRIGETNAVSCVGSPSASPTFASALWALDWSLRAASDGVKGLNFHGNFDACGGRAQSPICATSDRAAGLGEVTAQPEYYGLLAASRLEGGRFVPVKTITRGPSANLTSWATVDRNGTVTIAVDNMSTRDFDQPISIPISGYSASYEALIGPSVESRAHITLGGGKISNSGQWSSKSMPAGHRKTLRLIMRPASAIIVTLRPR
jgi:hypothetical protein